MASRVCFSHLHMKSTSAHTRMLSLCKYLGKQKNSVCPKQAYVTHNVLCFSQAIYMRNETLERSNFLFRKKRGEDKEKTKEMNEMNFRV